MRNSWSFKGSRAFVSIKTIFWLVFIGSFFYYFVISGGIYYRYYNAKVTARDLLTRVNYNPDEQLEEEYFKIIKKIGLPIKRKNYQFVREPGQVYIRVKYSERLTFGEYELYEFKFDIKEVRMIPGEAREEGSAEEMYSDEY